MVTYTDLFTFVIMIAAVTTLFIEVIRFIIEIILKIKK